MRALSIILLALACSPAYAGGPSFWLVDTIPGPGPAVAVVDDYQSAEACYEAALARQGHGFATCVALNEFAEIRLARAILHTMGED